MPEKVMSSVPVLHSALMISCTASSRVLGLAIMSLSMDLPQPGKIGRSSQ
jgi:hypothetical protein